MAVLAFADRIGSLVSGNEQDTIQWGRLAVLTCTDLEMALSC